MKDVVRDPKQKRSIKTKNDIIKASHILFSEVGYYNTNTAEIAKRAGVSTGIVYGYFKGKRDILASVLDIYIKNVYIPIFKVIDSFSPPFDVRSLASLLIDETLKVHQKNANIHEALHSMTHTDSIINAKFIELESEITSKILLKFKEEGFEVKDAAEKIHFSINIVEMFCHELVYDNHAYINYERLRTVVLDTITSLFAKK